MCRAVVKLIYLYNACILLHTDTLSLPGSETTEIATRLLLLFGSRSLSWDQRDPHNEWISLHLVFDSTLSLSRSLWQPHNERGEFATLVVSPREEKPLKVWALTYWHCHNCPPVYPFICSEWTWNATPQHAQSNGFCGFCIMCHLVHSSLWGDSPKRFAFW